MNILQNASVFSENTLRNIPSLLGGKAAFYSKIH